MFSRILSASIVLATSQQQALPARAASLAVTENSSIYSSTCDPDTEYLVQFKPEDPATNIETIFQHYQIHDTSDPNAYVFSSGNLLTKDRGTYQPRFQTGYDDDALPIIEGCLPRNACYMVEFNSRYASSVNPRANILVDGDTLWKKEVFHVKESSSSDEAWTQEYREFGSCDIQCNQNEDVATIDMFHDLSDATWRIEKAKLMQNSPQETTFAIIEAECGVICQEAYQYRFFRRRICLRNDECHRFVAAEQHPSLYSSNLPTTASFNVTFGGQQVVTLPRARFEARDFGLPGSVCLRSTNTVGSVSASSGSVATINSDNVCKGSDQTLLEVFVWRDFDKKAFPPLSLEVLQGNAPVLSLLDSFGIGPGMDYTRACVPKSCLMLTLSVPDTTGVVDPVPPAVEAAVYEERSKWMVALDGAVVRDTSFSFSASATGQDTDTNFAETIQVGKSCNPCGKQESLVEIELHTDPDKLYFQRYSWSIDYTDIVVDANDKPDIYLSGTRLFEGYFAGLSYLASTCVPTRDCSEFHAFRPENSTESTIEYVIRVDGVTKTNTEQTSNQGFLLEQVILSGNLCRSSMSKAGVALSFGFGILGLALFVHLGFCCAKTQTKTREEREASFQKKVDFDISYRTNTTVAQDESSSSLEERNVHRYSGAIFRDSLTLPSFVENSSMWLSQIFDSAEFRKLNG